MRFNIAARSLLIMVLGAVLCGCGAPRGNALWTAGGNAPALAEATERPREEPAVERGPAPRLPARSETVPTPAEIFDFHPPGAPPGHWRQPFVVSYTEGPLNAYRLRTLAELRRLRDHRYDLVPPSAVAAR